MSDGNIFQRNYQLEDFFWTGSGDGPVLEDSLNNETDSESKGFRDERFDGWRTTTVFHTTTILFATVYPDGESCSYTGCKPKVTVVDVNGFHCLYRMSNSIRLQTSPVWTGSVEFSSPVFPTAPAIEPTPTLKLPDVYGTFGNGTPFTGIIGAATITVKTTSSGSEVQGTPTSTASGIYPSAGVGRPGFDASGVGEGSGAAYPRFDVDLSSTAPTHESDILFDRRYWLLTVLKRQDYAQELKIHAIEEKLSLLYRKAFIRLVFPHSEDSSIRIV